MLRIEPGFVVDLLEATQSEAGDLSTWLERVAASANRLIPSVLGYTLNVLRDSCDDTAIIHLTAQGVPVPHVGRFAEDVNNHELVRAFYFNGRHVATTSQVETQLSRQARRYLQEHYLRALGARDVVALGARCGPDTSLVFASVQPETIVMNTPTKLLLGQVALHIEAALRMRLLPSSIVAVIDADGHVVHAEGEHRERDVRLNLSEHVRRIEKLKSKRRRMEEGVAGAWTALVMGKYGVVERSRAIGRREYVVVAQTESQAQNSQLSMAQARALELSARGLSGKQTAYALGVSQQEVSALLLQAALRIGCASRSAAVRLAAVLQSQARPAVHADLLTPAEREVLSLLGDGLSNLEIASRRDCSPRTVANQIAALLRKTRLPSRRALAALRTA